MIGHACLDNKCISLKVMWKGIPIGRLSRLPGGYNFYYVAGVSRLRDRGFVPMAEFPKLDDVTYKSDTLFNTFSQRIPSKSRPDYDTIMNEWEVVNNADEFEILGKSKGAGVPDGLTLECECWT